MRNSKGRLTLAVSNGFMPVLPSSVSAGFSAACAYEAASCELRLLSQRYSPKMEFTGNDREGSAQSASLILVGVDTYYGLVLRTSLQMSMEKIRMENGY